MELYGQLTRTTSFGFPTIPSQNLDSIAKKLMDAGYRLQRIISVLAIPSTNTGTSHFAAGPNSSGASALTQTAISNALKSVKHGSSTHVIGAGCKFWNPSF